MDMDFLEDIPNEVVFSSVVLGVIGALQFVPNSFVQILPASSFLSGFLGNMVDFVLVYSAQLPFHSYTLGFTLLVASTAPFVYSEKAWIFSFLTQTFLSFYGFISLLVILETPYLVSNTAILGLGAQVLLTGFIATQIFKNVLKSKAFSYEIDKTVYAVALWQYVTAVVAMSAFQYIYQFRILPIYAALFTVLGLYGVVLIYASVEIALNSRTGILISASFLTLIFLSSLVAFSFGGALSALSIAGLIYWKREKFERRQSLSTIRDFEF